MIPVHRRRHTAACVVWCCRLTMESITSCRRIQQKIALYICLWILGPHSHGQHPSSTETTIHGWIPRCWNAAFPTYAAVFAYPTMDSTGERNGILETLSHANRPFGPAEWDQLNQTDPTHAPNLVACGVSSTGIFYCRGRHRGHISAIAGVRHQTTNQSSLGQEGDPCNSHRDSYIMSICSIECRFLCFLPTPRLVIDIA